MEKRTLSKNSLVFLIEPEGGSKVLIACMTDIINFKEKRRY